MSKSIGVVGVGGVGMAHVIAAAKSGFEVRWIVDVDDEILANRKKEWRNEWLYDIEEVAVQAGTSFYRDLREVSESSSLPTTVVVIATPPHTHIDLTGSAFASGLGDWIICEKPVIYPKSKKKPYFDSNVVISGEWIFANYMEKPKTLHMAYPGSMTTDWGYQLVPEFDFLPHFFSIMLSQGIDIDRMERIDENAILAGNRNTKVVLSYGRKPPYGFFYNGRPVAWDNELLERQLKNPGRLVSWNKMLGVERLLWEVLGDY